MDKPKFIFIDAMLILFIVLVVGIGAWFVAGRGGKGGSSPADNITVEYKVQLTQAQPSLSEAFRKAAENQETVWVSEKERVEAVLVAAEVTPAQRITTDLKNDETILAESPVLHDITVTLRSIGTESETQITAGNTPIHVGEAVSVKGKGIAGYGFIVDLKLLD